jgi:hypothetical protein
MFDLPAGGASMKRREFVVSGLSGLFSYCCCSRAAISGTNQGCRMAGAGDAAFRRLIRDSSGNSFLDSHYRNWGTRLMELCGVHPGLCFYDDSLTGDNALATPDVLLEGGPDGTVMLGISLLNHETHRINDVLPETVLPIRAALFIIAAHEFGHIVQFKNGMSATDGPWQMEPHADFMAGWMLSDRYRKGEFMLEREVFAAANSIFEKGDTLFNDRAHHGEPEFRAAMIWAGYESSKLDINAAFQKGKVMAGLVK